MSRLYELQSMYDSMPKTLAQWQWLSRYVMTSPIVSPFDRLGRHYFVCFRSVLDGQRFMNTGYTYLMQAGDVFKIGMSTSPERRRAQIQRQIPCNVEIVHTVKTPDMFGLESALLSTFIGHKVPGQREWYLLTPDDVDFIKGLAS